ncbi:hypothetical protein NQ317_005076 [Molorchus minor]|uniref:Cytochrome P450 n=1 Tax=Molorchus minor TaxID=1323400 RepID=A0ABQ9JXC2_9CUCU|nr:hypothetical protein NQ317_005076 [Molorchus minor]
MEALKEKQKELGPDMHLIENRIFQDYQQKVYEEVMDIIGPDRPVKPEDLPHLKFTERFIKETLRLFPAGSFVVRAILEDVNIGEHVLVKGTSAIFNIYSVHTNEKYWPDPYRFNPDRFLPEEIAKRHPCTYLPFSYGPRNCIGSDELCIIDKSLTNETLFLGMKYGMMSMKTLVANVVRKCKLRTSYRGVEDIKLKSILVSRAKDGCNFPKKSSMPWKRLFTGEKNYFFKNFQIIVER